MSPSGNANQPEDSYLYLLAKRAIGNPIPDDLVVDPADYAKTWNKQDAQAMAVYLADKPRLQEQLAFRFDYVPSRWLLGQEIPLLIQRRQIHAIAVEDVPGGPGQPPKPVSDCAYEWASRNQLQGICFSGGGIRSATFNLGVLQGLAKLGMLNRFDYLSSVSGGGYIHQWFAAWIKREEDKPKKDAKQAAAAQPGIQRKQPQNDGAAVPANQGGPIVQPATGNPQDNAATKPEPGLDRVQELLQPLPAGTKLPFQPEPIRWLRRYSNYLTPQKGMFTADTWVAVAIWTRNSFLNQLILVSGLFCVVLAPPPSVVSRALWHVSDGYAGIGAVLLFAVAAGSMCRALRLEYSRVRYLDIHHKLPEQIEPRSRFGGEKSVQVLVVLPLLCASMLCLSLIVRGSFGTCELVTLFLLVTAMMAGLTLAGGAAYTYEEVHGWTRFKDVDGDAEKSGAAGHRSQPEKSGSVSGKEAPAVKLSAKQKVEVFFNVYVALALLDGALAACAGLGLTLAIIWALHAHVPEVLTQFVACSGRWHLQLVLGVPLLLSIPFFSMIMAAGLVGRNYPDWLREWLARVRAWSLLYGLGWVLYVGIALLGPCLVQWMIDSTTAWAATAKWGSVVGWLATTAGSVLAGKSSKTTGTAKDTSSMSGPLNLLAMVGPYVFILGLLLILSAIAEASLRFALAQDGYLPAALLVAVPVSVFILFGWRVDVNDFSMNSFYRNRLTRCYLGASNPHRDPNPLTGFDDRDTRGMQISRLKPDPLHPKHNYTGPLPIICATLNLSFGEDLAWQERKAASFFFSPLYSGYTVGWTAGKAGTPLSFNGFVPTENYAFPDGGINISTAVAISGAAASPNWGFHTNPATAFLMTMFNVRLGWWIFNPRRSNLAGQTSNAPKELVEEELKIKPSPLFAPLDLGRELLGMSDDTSKYVYLSDGGHFENMGLYELVRRRCHRIVICDAEEDEKYVFDGIGGAIRKCRIDFGVEITLDLSALRPNPKTGGSGTHFALGTIRYPETTGTPGTILYLKSSLSGAAKLLQIVEEYRLKKKTVPPEPLDIFNYKLDHANFPHDTTMNQWFTESQFESYRRLGQHVVEEIELCGQWAGFGR